MKKLLLLALFAQFSFGQTLTTSGTTYKLTGSEILTITNSWVEGYNAGLNSRSSSPSNLMYFGYISGAGGNFDASAITIQSLGVPVSNGDILRLGDDIYAQVSRFNTDAAGTNMWLTRPLLLGVEGDLSYLHNLRVHKVLNDNDVRLTLSISIPEHDTRSFISTTGEGFINSRTGFVGNQYLFEGRVLTLERITNHPTTGVYANLHFSYTGDLITERGWIHVTDRN